MSSDPARSGTSNRRTHLSPQFPRLPGLDENSSSTSNNNNDSTNNPSNTFVLEDLQLLTDLEASIRKAGIIKDHQFDGCLVCPRTVSGSDFVEFLLNNLNGKVFDCSTESEAIALGQRLIDANKIHSVEARTNRKIHRNFLNQNQCLFRFESDRTAGGEPTRAYSTTKFYFTKLQSHCSLLHIVGQQRSVPVFAVLSVEDETIYFFRNAEAGKPYDEIDIRQCLFFVCDNLDTSRNIVISNTSPTSNLAPPNNNNNSVNSNLKGESPPGSPIPSSGAFLVLITPARNLLILCSSIDSRNKWTSELSKLDGSVSMANTGDGSLPLPLDQVSPSSVANIVCDVTRFPPSRRRSIDAINEGGLAHNNNSNSKGAGVVSASKNSPNIKAVPGSGPSGPNLNVNPSASPLPSNSNNPSVSTSPSNNVLPSPLFLTPSPNNGSVPSPSLSTSNSNPKKPSGNIVSSPMSPSSTSYTNTSAVDDGLLSEVRQTKLQRQGEESLRALSSMSPHLGFSFDAVGENDNPYEGLLVDGVEVDSPAARAGLLSGDIVLECNHIRTLAVSDLLAALKGILPGSPLSLIIEREGEESELYPTLGAKGYSNEQVAQLFAAVQASLMEQAEARGTLSLADVLDVPQYRRLLLEYMEQQFCAESLNFLTAEQAYSRIPDTQQERRVYAGRLIASEFIFTDGEQVINIDDATRKHIIKRVRDSEKKNAATSVFTPSLFREAARTVFKMCESDVFKRFVKTNEYKEMMEDFAISSAAGGAQNPENQNNSVSRQKRRKEHSFAVVALEDKYSELDSYASEFSKTAFVTDHGFLLKKVKSAFKGTEFVSWLVDRQYAKQRPAAVAIGQRMYDAFLLRHVNDECEFEDSDKLFTFVNPASSGPSLDELREKSTSTNSSIHQGYLLLKGVHYNRVYVVLHREKKKLFLYRTHHAATAPMMKLRLKGATLRVFSDKKEADEAERERENKSGDKPPSINRNDKNEKSVTNLDTSADRGDPEESKTVGTGTGINLNKQSSASLTKTSSSSNDDESLSQRPRGSTAALKREVLTYVQLDIPAEHNRTVIFRIEGQTEKSEWLEEFAKAGFLPVNK